MKWLCGVVGLLSLVLVACGSSPTPTTDYQATIEALRQERPTATQAATSTPSPTATPTTPPTTTPSRTPALTPMPPSFLSDGNVASLLSERIKWCFMVWGVEQPKSETRYLGDHLWLVRLRGQATGSEFMSLNDGGPYFWDSGIWRLNEQTGDLQPYDELARNQDKTGVPLCVEVITTGSATPTPNQQSTATLSPAPTQTPTCTTLYGAQKWRCLHTTGQPIILPNWVTKMFFLPQGQVVNPDEKLSISTHVPRYSDLNCGMTREQEEELDALTDITFGMRLSEVRGLERSLRPPGGVPHC